MQHGKRFLENNLDDWAWKTHLGVNNDFVAIFVYR